MERDIDYSGPYSKQLNLEIRSSLSKIKDVLTDSIIQKEKNNAAKEMAKEMAIVNLMTQEFMAKKNELFTTKKDLISKGMDLPAIDSTAGYEEFLTLIDDVNADTLGAFADEINLKNQEILNMNEGYVDYLEGVKDRRGMELSEGLIADKFFDGDAPAYERFMLSGDIEDIGSGAYGFTPGSELAGMMKDMSQEDFEDLQTNEFWRQGFEQGAMSAGEAIQFQQTKEQLDETRNATQAKDWDMASKIINSTETELGARIAPNLNIGLKGAKLNAQYLFSAAAKGEVDQAYLDVQASIDAKSQASVAEGGAPNLTPNLISVVQQIIAGGGNAYDGLVYELGQTYEVRRDLTSSIDQYGISKGLDFQTAKNELLTDPDGANESLLTDPEWIEASGIVRSLYIENEERKNVGFESDRATMQQAYDLSITKSDLENKQMNWVVGQNSDTAKDAYDKYKFTPDSRDIDTDLYAKKLDAYQNQLEGNTPINSNSIFSSNIDNKQFGLAYRNQGPIGNAFDWLMEGEDGEKSDITFDQFVASITDASSAKYYVGGFKANTLLQAVKQYNINPDPDTKAFVESFYNEWRE